MTTRLQPADNAPFLLTAPLRLAILREILDNRQSVQTSTRIGPVTIEFGPPDAR